MTATKVIVRAATSADTDAIGVHLPAHRERDGVFIRGIASAFPNLGYVSLFAGITLPNEASVGLHEAVGFEAVGGVPARQLQARLLV